MKLTFNYPYYCHLRFVCINDDIEFILVSVTLNDHVVPY